MSSLKTYGLGDEYSARLGNDRKIKEASRSNAIEGWRVSGGEYQ